MPNGLKIQVADSYEAMSRQATAVICRELGERPDLLLCASAGSTPTRTYELLARRCAAEPELFSWLRVVQIDEWVGLTPGDPATCEADLRAKILRPLAIPRNRFKGLSTNAADPQAECDRMARWLVGHGPIDICILGLGQNGHVAMNEPAEWLSLQTHVAVLAASSRNHGMLRTLAKKPRYGLSLGVGDILDSRKILLLVSGQQKRSALKRLATSQITTDFPASLLSLHRDATVLCDRGAAADLDFHR